MDPELFKIHLHPLAGDGGGGAATPVETLPENPTLNSVADSGLSPEELAASPSDADLGIEPAATPAVASTTPADPNLAGAARTDVTQTQAQTIRDAARHYGLDLSQYADDGQAFAALAQMAIASRQANYYADLGQRIAPHYEGVQEYLRQREATQAKPAERKPWEAPPFDEKWLNYVRKDDATGMYVSLPGAPPWVAEKVQAYADHLETWTTQVARNPAEALGPLIEHVAERLLEQRFGQQQAVQQAQQIVQQNESWIYATDANGRRIVTGDGRFVPTPLGARYYTHLQTLRRGGITDAATLDTLAKQLLQGELYAQNAGKTAAAATAAAPQAVAAAARPNVNPGQAVQPGRRQVVPGATEPDATGLSLRERLAQAMHEEGVTDADLMQQFA
jgi:hypothetical protein